MMDLDKESLRRLLKSKIAQIAKLKKQIHAKDVKIQRKQQFAINKNIQKIKKDEENIDIPQNDEDRSFKKKFIEDLLKSLEKEGNGNRYSDLILDMCFSLFTISPNAYYLLRSCLALPCEKTLRNHFQDKVKEETENLLNLENKPETVVHYRETYSVDKQFDIVIGVDACAFDRVNAEGSKYAFCFYAQPIYPNLPCFPVYIVPTIDGKASTSIIIQMKQIIEIFEKCDIKVVCSACDGDSAYNILNEETFEIFMKDAFHEGLDEAIAFWDSFNGDKHISDMLHSLKIARSRLLTGNISLNSEFIYHTLNSKSLESILLLGQPLTDDSPIGKMKDF